MTWLALGLGLLAALLLASRLYAHNPARPLTTTRDRLPPHDDLADLVERLLAEMSLSEKLEQLSGDCTRRRFEFRYFRSVVVFGKAAPIVYSGENERLGIPPFGFSDGPRGVSTAEGATAFPVTMARGASWDVELERRVGEVMGREALAGGANYSGAVCINLLRHPGWGRAQETYGEDPHHLGQLGLALTRGIQSQGVMACVKHLACNSIENARFRVDVRIDDRALHEVYLPHFKVVVSEAASVMSAYHRLRGEHCGHSRELLGSILRERWGYEGFVTSDWIWGVRDGVRGITAGMDVEMPARWHYGSDLERAVREGELDEEQVDACVRRVLRTRLPYALSEPPPEGPELIGCDEHRQLAREVAEQSAVLLQNDGTLPLTEDLRVGVFGKLATLPATGDVGSSRVPCSRVVTLLEGLQARHDRVELFRDPKRAGEVDVAVVVVGFTHRDEGEYIVLDPNKGADAWQPPGVSGGGDRRTLGLRPDDVSLIEGVAERNPRTVVVLVGGSAITAPWRQRVGAILHAFYPGQEGGDAVAALLFGDLCPSGKLPFTVPEDESDLPEFDPFGELADYDLWHGYSRFEAQGRPVAWAFGHGLSYTSFVYRDLRLEQDELGPEDTLRATVTLENTGSRDAREVVQLYVGFPDFPVPRAPKLLRAFTKVLVPASERVEVSLEVAVAELAWFDPELQDWRLERREYQVFVGPSSRPEDLLERRFRVLR